MSKAKVQPVENRSAWFRQYYEAAPNTNTRTSNAEVIKLWKADHPGQEWTVRHYQAMASVKKGVRDKYSVGKPGRKKKIASNGEASAPKTVRVVSTSTLESLEYAIDRILMQARGLEEKDAGVQKVTNHLRLARNEVVHLQAKH
jgi:hypothetical protein